MKNASTKNYSESYDVGIVMNKEEKIFDLNYWIASLEIMLKNEMDYKNEQDIIMCLTAYKSVLEETKTS